MSILKRFTKTDKLLLTSSLVVGATCVYLLSPRGEEWLYSEEANHKTSNIVGTIITQENDTRFRSLRKLQWDLATKNKTIYAGDSIFSGDKSSLKIQLENKSEVLIGENSLVNFEVVDKKSIAKLDYGNFRIKVDGKVKLKIQGKLTEIDGKDSEVQVYMDKENKPVIKSIQGEVTVNAENKPEEKLIPIEPPQEVISLNQENQEFIYYWKLYDLYEKNEFELTLKPITPRTVYSQRVLTWSKNTEGKSVIQVSGNSDFSSSQEYQTDTSSVLLEEVNLGENFWRVSSNAKDWSEPAVFKVNSDYLKGEAPTAKADKTNLLLTAPTVSTTAHLKLRGKKYLGYIVQASLDPAFEESQSKTFWSSISDVKVVFNRPGEYYYRFKTVNKNQELSTWSDPILFSVNLPEKPFPPKLARSKKEGYIKEEFPIVWQSKELKVFVEIKNDQGALVEQLEGASTKWVPQFPGRYTAYGYSVNKYGIKSDPSYPLEIEVKNINIPLALVEDPKRDPSSVENQNSTKPKVPDKIFLNDQFKTSQFSLNGFLWALFSSQQYYTGSTSPVVSGLGAHGLYWKGSHGFEGSVKSGIASVNSAGNAQVAMKDFEVRYHYRFNKEVNSWLTREVQFSLFGGIESYQSSGTGFVSAYSLAKFGTAIEFPWREKWMTGGEFVYGKGTDSSQKYEISGNLSYFLKPEWSVGIGYRIHLFEAGSAASAPGGSLPYREGYTEGSSFFNYHFK